MHPLIYLNASIFAQIIRDPASPTEEVSIRFFMNLCKSSFPNNVLVSKFHGWMQLKFTVFQRTARHPTEETCTRTCTETGSCEQSCFWQGKKGVVLHYHWEILTKVYNRLFIKTLKNLINLWKMGIRWPLFKKNSSTLLYTVGKHGFSNVYFKFLLREVLFLWIGRYLVQ